MSTRTPFNTLRDIAQHSDKVIILTNYLARDGLDIHISALAKVNPTASPQELIMAFDKDLADTSEKILKVFELISTADENDIVHHIKDPVKDLKVIFGDNYDPKRRVLKFKSFEIDLQGDYCLEDIKDLMVKPILDINIEQYLDLKLKRNKIFQFNDASLVTEMERVQYLSAIKQVEQHKDVITKIRTLSDEFFIQRAKTPLTSLNLIDDSITFNRGMLDSVIKSSTYITKELGITQIAKQHRGDPELLKELQKAIDESSLFDGVEVDQDSSIAGMISLIKQAEFLKPNMSKNGVRLILKSRKCGSQGGKSGKGINGISNTRGIYFSHATIIVVDERSPASLGHELMHAIEFNNKAIRESPAKKMMVNECRKLMDLEKLTKFFGKSHVDYLKSDVEIFARMGEIGQILIKHNYEKGEDFEAFADRVRAHENENVNPYSLNMLNTIDNYIGQEDVYFNIATAHPILLNNIMKFTKVCVGVDGAEPETVNDLNIERPPAVNHGEKPANARFEAKSVALFTPENVRFAFDFNDQEKIVEPEVLLRHMLTQITSLNRTTLSRSDELISNQRAIVNKIVDYLEEKDNPYLTSIAINNLAEIGCYNNSAKNCIDLELARILKDGLKANATLSLNTAHEVFAERLSLAKDVAAAAKSDLDAEKTENRYSKEIPAKEKFFWECTRATHAIEKEGVNLFLSEKREKLPNTSTIGVRNEQSDTWWSQTKKVPKSFPPRYENRHYTESARNSFSKPLANFVVEQLNSDNGSKIINYFTKDDIGLYVLLADPKFRALIEPQNLLKIDNQLNGVIIASGLIDVIYENTSFAYEEGEKRLLCSGSLLEGFPYEKLGISDAISLSAGIADGTILQSQLLNLIPDHPKVFSEWTDAQLEIADISDQFNHRGNYDPLTVDNIEEVVQKLTAEEQTELDLDSFLLEFEVAPPQAPKPKSLSPTAEALENQKKAAIKKPKPVAPKPPVAPKGNTSNLKQPPLF